MLQFDKTPHVILAAVLLLGAQALHAACWETPDDVPPVTFTASQAGAPITGSFTRYRGHLCLPGAESDGSARVEIDTASIDMGLPEFNAEMRGPLWFATETWPTAVFAAERLEPLGNGRYRVSGRLTIRDVTRQLDVELALAEAGDELQVTGEVSVSRLDFNVGQGEWADTRWVGDAVTIAIATSLRAAG